MHQAVKIAPLRPSPVRQKKMSHTIFGSDEGAEFEKVAATDGLEVIHLPPVVLLYNPAFVNFGQQVFKFKPRVKRAGINSIVSKFPGQVALQTVFAGSLIHK